MIYFPGLEIDLEQRGFLEEFEIEKIVSEKDETDKNFMILLKYILSPKNISNFKRVLFLFYY